jgi:type VI secretion system protein ImpK
MQHHLVVQECFNSVVRLREAGDDMVCASDVHALLSSTLQRIMGTPAALGLTTQDGADIAFAIVALADEVAMRAGEHVAAMWQYQSLQTKFFDEHSAGDHFYDHLTAVRDSPRGRAPVLFAYYTALALGFEGRLGDAAGRAEIKALMAALRRELEGPKNVLDEPLSPHALAQRHQLAPKRRGVLAADLMLAAMMVGVVLGIAGLRISLAARVQQLEELAGLRVEQVRAQTLGAAGQEAP